MYTILVIDDDPDIPSALNIYLSAEGYRVLQAANGQEGLTPPSGNVMYKP